MENAQRHNNPINILWRLDPINILWRLDPLLSKGSVHTFPRRQIPGKQTVAR
jgi:hypothetical protein